MFKMLKKVNFQIVILSSTKRGHVLFLEHYQCKNIKDLKEFCEIP